MEQFSAKILAMLKPDSFGDGSGGWQQRKSAEMRIVILEAAIDCLVTSGYSNLSIQSIAVRAGISRGAMHHHFASKMQIVAATIEYTFYRRMQNFLVDFFNATKKDPNVVGQAADLHWNSVETREYGAYIQLAIAARTDAELNEYFMPAARRFDRVWSDEMVRAFPQWKDHLENLQVANDLAIALHLGLLINKPIFSEKRVHDVRGLLLKMLRELHAGTARPD